MQIIVSFMPFDRSFLTYKSNYIFPCQAIRSYNEIINTPKLNGSVQYYTALFDKSLLLHEKMGDKDEAFSILKELTSRRSKSPIDIKGNAYIALGQLIISDGNPQDRIDDALKCYNKAIDLFNSKADLQPMTVPAKKHIAMAHYKLKNTIPQLTSCKISWRNCQDLRCQRQGIQLWLIFGAV